MRLQQTDCYVMRFPSFKGTQKNIILMSPMQQVPIELEKEVVVIDFTLPDMAELKKVLTQHVDQNRGRRLTTEAREKLLRAALGLTKDEAEKVYRRGAGNYRAFDGR